MVIKGLVDEDFVNYKKPSMVIMFPHCTFKCEKDCGQRVCQNSTLAQSPDITISMKELCTRYLSNFISQAIVCGGLEPMDSFDDLISLILTLRYEHQCNDDIVIYTGYTERECMLRGWLDELKHINNIIVKFGRYTPNQQPHFDEVLGVNLASDNQYAKLVSEQEADVDGRM